MPTTTPFNNLITFSRGSNATLTGPNGLIQWAPNNLLTFSEQFNDGAWTKAGTTISANTTAAPDGTTTADKQIEDTSTGDHRILNNIAATVTANVTYTWSVYAKAAERTSVRVTNNSLIGATFDLTDGTFSNVSAGITAASTSVGNGWYRLAITGLAATSSERLAVYLVSGGATSYTGNGASGAFIWGAQLELGSTTTTYNPTTVKNLLGFSEAFDNAAWTKGGASIVTGAQANPINGLFNAQKLMEDTSTGDHRTFQAASVSNGTPYVFSAYVKPAGRTLVNLTSVSGALMNVTFDISSGVVTSTTNGVGSIVSVGSGWYRIAVLATATSTASANFQIRLLNNVPALSYTGDGNSGVYIYGAQLSDSASLDPYVPTPGAAPSSTAFYGPRFDYDPVTLQPRGILIEEQRTNLALYSEQFDNAAWSKVRSSVTANSTLSPDGATNADKLVEDTTASNTHSLQQTFSATTGTSYTFAVYLKAAERGWAALQFNSAIFADASSRTAYFNLSTGAVGNTVGSPVTNVANAGNGWWRVSITVSATLTATGTTFIYLSDGNGGALYTGNGTSGIFLYGAQLEAGAFATSYIPTIASTVTRSADVATITGQNFAQWYRQDEGAIIADFATFVPSAFFNASTPIAMSINDNTTNNRIDIFNGGVTTYTRVNIGVGGVSQAILDTVPAISSGKATAAYAVNNFASSVAGGAVVTDNSGSLPVVNQLQLGALTTAARLNGWLRAFRFIPARAADFQLQGLST